MWKGIVNVVDEGGSIIYSNLLCGLILATRQGCPIIGQ